MRSRLALVRSSSSRSGLFKSSKRAQIKICEYFFSSIVSCCAAAPGMTVRAYALETKEPPNRSFFASKPRAYWKLDENVRTFCKYLAGRIGLTSANDWYQVMPFQIANEGGQGLLRVRGSLEGVLRVAHPEHDWLPWKFKLVPSSYWREKANQRRYLDWLARELNYSSRDDWYNIDAQTIQSHYGSSLLVTQYKGSPSALVTAVYDDYSASNIRSMVDWIKEKERIEQDSELQKYHFSKNGASGLLRQFYESPRLIVQAAGGHGGAPRKPRLFWHSIENQRAFMDDLAHSLNFHEGERERWYEVQPSLVVQHGGRTLLNHHKGSLYSILLTVYPEFDWLPWKFHQLPKFSWKNPELLEKALRFVADKLHLQTVEEWHRVTSTQLNGLGVATLFSKNGGVDAVIKIVNSRKT